LGKKRLPEQLKFVMKMTNWVAMPAAACIKVQPNKGGRQVSVRAQKLKTKASTSCRES